MTLIPCELCSLDEKSLSSWDIRDENLVLSGFDVGSDLVKFEPPNPYDKNLGRSCRRRLLLGFDLTMRVVRTSVSGIRLSNTWVTYSQVGDNSGKLELIPGRYRILERVCIESSGA